MSATRPDWAAWHERYDEEGSTLRQRLEIVTRHIVAALDATERSPVRVISICAGQARDLTGAIERTTRRDLVGRLVELNQELAADARARLQRLNVSGVEVVIGDAGQRSAYLGVTPADLVLVCGVFGNVSDVDVETTIRALPELCAPGATLVWTRHRRPPDLTVHIRRWLTEVGFENGAFETVEDPRVPGAVGVAVFKGPPHPLGRRPLFTFDDDMVMPTDGPAA